VRTLSMLLISMISFPLVFIRNNSIFQAIMMYIVMVFAILLVFIYAPNEQMQGIVQKIFYFHVSSSVTAFSAFFLVFVASIMYLWKNAEWWDAVALSAAEIGVVFCTLVLITGPIWARPIWGTWWSWDPTLTLTLVLWLIYVAYLMLRMDAHDPKRARFAAVLGIVGYVEWRTLHPKPVLIQEGGTTGLPFTMLLTFAVCLVAFMLLFFYLLRERVSIIQSQHTIEVLRHQVDNLPTG
jgi:heme exporter protein C